MPHTVRKHRPSGSSFGVYFRLFLSLALIVGFCWVIFSDAMPGQILPPTQGSTEPSTAPATYRDDTFYEVRGVWVASASNLDFPSAKGLSAEDLKAELDQIVATVKAAGLNTVFFQVRPHADSLYASAVYPWSAWVSGVQGQAPDGGFDPLTYIIEKAHAEGLQLHAWVNPFRILSGTEKAPADTSVLAENSPAVLHPEWTVEYAGSLVFDPGIPEVRQMVINGVKEIAQRYEVDGIHFDDYFYPYRVTLANGSEANFDDADTFASYGKEGQTLDEFRLESINLLVRDACEAIHQARPGCEFGISPFGVWRTAEHSELGFDTDGVLESYTDHYADSYTWVKEGWVDYIAPQLYWSMDTAKTPFDELYRWWAGVTADTDVKLLAGHAYHKVGTEETGWSDSGELIQQVRYIRANSQYGGSIFYRYADLKANKQGVTDALKEIYAQEFSLELPKGTGALSIEFPSEYYATASPSLCITGVADNLIPLYCNGVSLSTTRHGRFAHFVELSEGENRFVFQQGESVRTIVIQRKSTTSYTLMDKEELRVLWPSSDFIDASGTEATLRVTAPAGSTITARVGTLSVELKQTDNTLATVDGKPCRAEFTGVLTLPKMSGTDATVSLGKVSFEATTPSGATLTAQSGGEIMILLPQTYSYAVVINDNAVIYESPDVQGTAYTAAPEGMTDYIYAQDQGYYRFRYGGWIKMTDVEYHRDAKLWINYMESVKAKVNGDFVEIRFDMKENVPASGRCENGDFVLTVYNTKKANLRKIPALNNALYSSVTYESLSDNVAEYTFDLKGGFYGFDLSYEEGEILLVRLRLPKTASDGAQPLQGFKILLDAGHGGDDPGAEGIGTASGLSEAELNLAVVLELRTRLEKLGATVTLTRNDDSTVLLAERVKLFDRVKPDLSLSIHHNAVAETVDAGTVRGISGHYTHDAGRQLAEALAASVAEELMLEKRADYRMQLAITNRHELPAALLELGFVTSPEEYESMLEADYASRTAAAIAKALVDTLS